MGAHRGCHVDPGLALEQHEQIRTAEEKRGHHLAFAHSPADHFGLDSCVDAFHLLVMGQVVS